MDCTEGTFPNFVNISFFSPIDQGGGGAFWPNHQMISCNSRTLSAKVFKVCDFSFIPFSFMAFGNIVMKFLKNFVHQGFAAFILRTGGHKNTVFFLLFKIAEISREYNFWSRKPLLVTKTDFSSLNPISVGN